MHTHVSGLSQPQLRACSNPSTDSAMPTAITRAPRQSIRSRRAEGAMPAVIVSTRATTATGTLIQKIARHVHWVR